MPQANTIAFAVAHYYLIQAQNLTQDAAGRASGRPQYQAVLSASKIEATA